MKKPRWLCVFLGDSVPYGCKECDDTGVLRYWNGRPDYCLWCQKGEALKLEARRQARIRAMEDDLEDSYNC